MPFRPRVAAVLVAAVLGLLLAHPARADLVFQFSFVITGGDASSGTVTGEIFGLTDNATSAATDIVITGIPDGAPGFVPAMPLDVFATMAYANSNTFTVADGVITSGLFVGGFGPGGQNSLQLSPGTGGSGFPGALSFHGAEFMDTWSVVDRTNAVTYTPVAATEPASIAVVGVGLFGLAMMRRRSPSASCVMPRGALAAG